MARKRDYSFTDFVLDESFLQGLPYEYLCYGKEICPDTGKQHLQGYIYFKNAKTFSAARKLLQPRHIETSNASTDDNVKYCSKDGDFMNLEIDLNKALVMIFIIFKNKYNKVIAL
eukprot:TRINITY_DN5_c0_g1_i7.p1 TRINITY_DN5_c0_g1~~TRINITY_DN5_c0_g1_i7.p1  ORF type:complete len:115 (-),score=3.19 TRINITY_DN5_c0_g1_i7:747-1091(-)